MSRAPVWGSPLVKPLKKDSLTALTLSTHELSDRESSVPRTDTSLKNHGFCYMLAGSSQQSQPFGKCIPSKAYVLPTGINNTAAAEIDRNMTP
jgi:hypothetical protein